jgi:hypothetical protein
LQVQLALEPFYLLLPSLLLLVAVPLHQPLTNHAFGAEGKLTYQPAMTNIPSFALRSSNPLLNSIAFFNSSSEPEKSPSSAPIHHHQYQTIKSMSPIHHLFYHTSIQ